MKVIIFDTETTSLSPSTGQVIEIAGVYCELNLNNLKLQEVDEFQTTVSLRSDSLDEKVTRITGITEAELDNAPTLFKAQEAWLAWVESHTNDKDQVYMVGHSVDFDLGFLKNEGWFLPLNYN